MTATRDQGTKNRKAILDTLRAQGPMAVAQLAKKLKLPLSTVARWVGILTQSGHVKTQGQRPKLVKLPWQQVPAGASLSSRRFHHRKGDLGVQATQELLEAAYKLYRDGHNLGPAGLARELGVSHAHGIAAVGQLRALSLIVNYFDTYRLNPRVERIEARRRLRTWGRQAA